MKAAVIYGRVSTTDQDTDRQIFELKELAKKEGFSIVESFVEKITGKKSARERQAFDSMLTYIMENDIKQVYSWELSRVGRNTIDINQNIKAFRDAGINIYIKKENINTAVNDANTQLQLNILASLAEYELSTIKARTISGTYNSIRKGGVGSGSIKQYGYKKDNGKLVIDEAEAAVVREICDLYLNKNWGLGAIASYLNNNGVETRYRKLIESGTINYKLASKLVWTDGSIGRLLHKRLLTGYRTYGKVELQDEALRIIDNATFDAIQVKMQEKRKTQANAQKYENILKGSLVCGHCGGSLIMHKGKSALANHYKCYNRFVVKSGCNEARMIDIDLLNNVVYELTKDFQVSSSTVLQKIEENNGKIEQLQNTLNIIAKEVASIELAQGRLVDLYMSGRIDTGIYDSRYAESKSSVEELTKKKEVILLSIDKLKNENEILNSKKVVDLKNPVIFKENIKSLVEKVEISALNTPEILSRIEAGIRESYSILGVEQPEIIEFSEILKEANLHIIPDYVANENKLGEYSKGSGNAILTSKNDIIYRIKVIMFDGATQYLLHVNSRKNNIQKKITIGRK